MERGMANLLHKIGTIAYTIFRHLPFPRPRARRRMSLFLESAGDANHVDRALFTFATFITFIYATRASQRVCYIRSYCRDARDPRCGE